MKRNIELSTLRFKKYILAMTKFLLCFLLVLFCKISLAQQSTDKGPVQVFRAAVVKIDSTPDNSQELIGYDSRQSKGVHDCIYHRIVALDDCTTQFFLVSTEMCDLSPVEYDHVATQIKNQLGISGMKYATTPHFPTPSILAIQTDTQDIC
jgi:neutral ceramidase